VQGWLADSTSADLHWFFTTGTTFVSVGDLFIHFQTVVPEK
jgi:hypothetical protein